MERDVEELPKVKIGQRVRVVSADQSRDLGLGTYMGEAPMSEIPDEPAPECDAIDHIPMSAEQQEVVGQLVEELEAGDETTPRIKLDSGETVYGFQCWWSTVDDEDGANPEPTNTTVN